MKKLILAVFAILGMANMNDVSAQTFYGTADGTRFLLTGNGRPYIKFRDDVRILDPEEPLPEYAVVTFAAIEVYGLDQYNNQVPLTALTSDSGSGYWYGSDFIDAPETYPEIYHTEIVTIEANMVVQYYDPIAGYSEVSVSYSHALSGYGFDADDW